MFEIGGLLDPLGRLWGISIALALLALLPDKAVVPVGWTPKLLRSLMLLLSMVAVVFAVAGTAYGEKAGALSWNIVPSALIQAGIFIFFGRLGSAIGHRFRKNKAQNPADDSQTSGGDS